MMADILSIVDATDSKEGEFSVLEAILPLQFYGARRRASETQPVRCLMIAMLVDAVRCFQTKFEVRRLGMRQEFAKVRSWIFSDQDDGPFSFRAVCDELEVEPEALRQGLLRWAAERGSSGKSRMIRRIALPARRISA
jgi:hypothetical protein